jgi:hypothetical protein
MPLTREMRHGAPRLTRLECYNAIVILQQLMFEKGATTLKSICLAQQYINAKDTEIPVQRLTGTPISFGQLGFSGIVPDNETVVDT